MRLILGLPPPHRPHFSLLGLCPVPVPSSAPVPAPVSVPAPRWFLSQSPHRPHFPSSVSTPHRSPPPFPFPLRFPHLFSCLPRAGLCPSLCLGPSLVFASVPVPAPVSVPAPRWFLSQSPHRPHFPSSVSAPYRSPPPLRFPRLFPCLPPRLFPCLPPRRSLSQSQSSFQPPLPFPLLYPCLPLCLPRAGLCPSLCLGLRPASVSPALRSVRSSFRVPKVACRTVVLLFPWIPLYSVPLLRFFYPASFLLSLCQGWNSCISKFLVVYLRKI